MSSVFDNVRARGPCSPGSCTMRNPSQSDRSPANSRSQAVQPTRSARCVGDGRAKRAGKSRGARLPKLRQSELEFRSWGGARKGAGRKPKGERAGMAHVSRPQHKARFPLLITSRLRPGLHSLRHESEAECIRVALDDANSAAAAQAAAGSKASAAAPFQVVHHSIQSNHLHLIVEADDRASLTSGMRGLLVRIARALNRLWKRRGPVFADRFHERELRKPLQVRNALVYVLQNLRKHGISLAGPDPLSSGPAFDGWDTCVAQESKRVASVASSGSAGRATGAAHTVSEEWKGERRAGSGTPSRFSADRTPGTCKPIQPGRNLGTHASGGSAASGIASLVRAARAEVPQPKTWLLGVGWKTHGLIDPRESPRRP